MVLLSAIDILIVIVVLWVLWKLYRFCINNSTENDVPPKGD